MKVRRSGQSLDATAGKLLVTSPLTVERWLLRTSRLASPDPAIHVGARFAAAFGRDPSFVSRIEGGTRRLPDALRDRWFQMINLDRTGVDHYLAEKALDAPLSTAKTSTSATAEANGRILFDAALHGGQLTPQQWDPACRAAVASGLPRTLDDFCAIALDALVAASPADYPRLVTALTHMPARTLVRGVRDVVKDVPSRGYQAIDLLAAVDGDYSGILLLDYFRDLPDPWMLRSVAEAMRRLVERGHVTSLVQDVDELQRDLVESMAGAPSWTSRIELANLVVSLGPLPRDVRRRLAEDSDMDVRIAVWAQAKDTVTPILNRFYAEAILPTLDAMPGRSDTEDDIALALVGKMIFGCNRRQRIQAAQVLGLSTYRHRVAAHLAGLLGLPSTELRRTAAQALMYFPPTDSTLAVLVHRARTDSDPDVRGRATWSLMPHATALDPSLLDALLTDRDESARRCAVDLAAAAGYLSGLRKASADPAPHIAADAAALLARISPSRRP